MPSIVYQVFHVSVKDGTYSATSVPATSVFNVSLIDGTYRVSVGEDISIFNVSAIQPVYQVSVSEVIQYNVTLTGGGGISDAPNDGSTYGRNSGSWVVVAGTGAVDSVFGRTGNVIAVAGDYTPSLLGQEGATDGQAIIWNNTSGQWEPTDLTGGGAVDSVNGQTGVVVLDYTDVGAAAAVHTHSLSDLLVSGAVANQVPQWNGFAWVPATLPAAPVDSVFGRTGAIVPQVGDYSTNQVSEDINFLYYTDSRVSANVDVSTNTALRHTHTNKVQLDLITDGDHDVRTDNPHGVDFTQAGAAAASHTHDPRNDLTQASALDGQVLVWNNLAGRWEPTTLSSTAPVDSVNGQTGVVVLDYIDVGAAATVHTHVAADVTDFDTEVGNQTDVAANTTARHTHPNKPQLDLITDGDHDVRIDNPHGVTPAQVGLDTTDDLPEGLTNLYFQEAPNDGGTYGRSSLSWTQITSGAALPLGMGTWTYSSTTTTPPAVGEIRFNNANPALATKMYVNETDADGVNKSAVLARVYEAGAEMYLQDRADKTDYWLGDVVTATDQGTWFEVDVTSVSLTGSFTNGEEIVQVLLAQAATTAPVTSVFGRAGVVIAQPNDYTWAYIDKTISSLADITTRGHALLADAGTNTHAQIDTHIGDTTGNPHAITPVLIGAAPTVHTHPLTALEQSGGAMNDGIYWNGTTWTAGVLPAILAAKEPTGFVDRADSTISFVDATRTFTIAPTGAQFEVWQQGSQYIKTSAEAIVIPDITGPHFVYYDEGVLSTTTTYTNDLIAKFGYIAYLYWNSAQASAILIGDERHGLVMSSATHQYLHLTRGAVIQEGFGLGSFTTDASGDLDVHAQFASVAGTYWDEDIEIDIPALAFPANIPVVYLTGAGLWTKDAATAFPVKNFVGGNGLVAWNEFTGGVWVQTEATNNDFVLAHIFATNDPDEPYIAVQGQDEYDNLGQARAGAIVELGILTDPTGAVLTPELIAIGSIIYQTSNGYTNAAKARVRTTDEGTDYIPWTGGPDTLQFGTPPASHTNLLDIGLNTHPQIDTHIADVLTNPHGVTFTQAVTADPSTDITAVEAETLTNGSNADLLHVHDHGALGGLGDDDHLQYHTNARGDLRYLQIANNLSDLATPSIARTNLGLGTAATADANEFLQPDNDLADVTDAGNARDNLGLGSAAVQDVTYFALAVHTHVVSAITNWSTFNETVEGIVVNGATQDFPLTLISSDAAIGMRFQDNGGIGDLYFAGASGANGRWYFRDDADTILMRIDDENVTIDDGMHIPYVAKVLNSRGPDNMVTNTGGDFGYNYNFTDFVWDPDVVYQESGVASFSRTSGNSTDFNDELISVDPSKTYEMGYQAIAANSQQHFGGIACYDVDGLWIETIHTMRFANTDTTLAAALNNGDTTITLTDATNWKGKDGTTGIVSFQRAFTLYGYTNSLGHTYDDYTYSRNHSGVGAWDDTGTAFTGNVLTLSTTAFPTGWQGGSFPSGTAISNASAGANYKYIAASNVALTTAWSTHDGLIGGVDLTGTNLLNKFQPGTASVRLLFLLNRTSASTSWIFQPYFGTPNMDVDPVTEALTLPALNVAGAAAFAGTVSGIDAADVSAVSSDDGTFSIDFPNHATPLTSDYLLAQKTSGGGLANITLGTLPISTAAQTALDAKASEYKTKTIYIEDPTATDSFPMGTFPVACTLISVTHECDTGSVSFNLEERATGSSAGTDVFAADQTATSSGSSSTGFSNSSMALGAWLQYAASAITGTPTKLWISVRYREDD